MNELIVVLDIETTGRNNMKDEILEVGVLISRKNFQASASKSVLIDADIDWERMDQVVQRMHSARHPNEGYGRSLFEDISDAKSKKIALTYTQAENRLIGFLEAHGVAAGTLYLTGSTISFDRGFLQVYMPELNNFFHYRSVDVSSLQAVIEMFYPDKALDSKPVDRKIHRTIPDCEDSLRKYEWAVQTLKGGALPDE